MWWLASLAALVSWPLEYALRYVLSLAPLVREVIHISLVIHVRWPHYLWITPHHFIHIPPWRPPTIIGNQTNTGGPFPWRHPRPVSVAP